MYLNRGLHEWCCKTKLMLKDKFRTKTIGVNCSNESIVINAQCNVNWDTVECEIESYNLSTENSHM